MKFRDQNLYSQQSNIGPRWRNVFFPIWRNIFYFKKNTLLFHRSTTLQGRKYSSISEERNSKRKKGATVYLERTLIFSDLLFQCFPVFLPLFQRFLVFSVLCPHVFTVVYALPSALQITLRLFHVGGPCATPSLILIYPVA